MVKVEILADSVNLRGNRVTTFKIKFPRIIEAEILRHRMLSFSAASSRAINLEKHIEKVEKDPFIPTRFTKDCRGMSAKEYLSDTQNAYAEDIWRQALEDVLIAAKKLNNLGVHKQHASRLLQPFEYQEMIVTGTDWENFFSLRCPQYYILGLEEDTYRSQEDVQRVIKKYDTKGFDPLKHNKSTAQPEIQELAEMMYTLYHESQPMTPDEGEWHIPFEPEYHSLREFLNSSGGKRDYEINYDEICRKVACARIARISYLNESNDYQKDIELFDKLVKMKHWSPLEHVCVAMSDEVYNLHYKSTSYGYEDGWCANYRGFISLRHLIENKV